MKTFLFAILVVGIYKPIHSQVLVKDEPKHATVFENRLVRILDVWIKPGDTSLYHKHETPSVFICYTKTLMGNQEMDKEQTYSQSTKGAAWYRSFSDAAQIHRVWNRDSIPFHTVDIEILTKGTVSISKNIEHPNIELVSDEERARIYKIKIFPKENINFKIDNNPIVLSFVEGDVNIIGVAKNAVNKLKSGKCLWIDGNNTVLLSNTDDKVTWGYIFEIKL